MMQKIRSEMAKKGNVLLKGIIEADETYYIGGKPRKAINVLMIRKPNVVAAHLKLLFLVWWNVADKLLLK
ncbi:MAG: hypothetical protein OXM61_13510 [Candidatus Poribacteria bacterium]|nr:hypothetical protein [Candidatus Poribacteria bacterium]